MNSFLLKKNDLTDFIEPYLLSKLVDNNYLVECVNPETLVTYNRLDIGFRTLYLELKDLHPVLADEIYHHDLRAQSLGTLIDPDNSDKSSFYIFKNVFSSLTDSINKVGFDFHKTLIPVSSSGSILNGGHRLSASLHLGKDVWILRTGLPAICCDYDYFFRRSVPVHIIEMGVFKLLEFAPNTHIAFLWPSGKINWDVAEALFSNVIYKKNIDLTFQGAFNLLYQCYRHMDWTGSSTSGFHGIQQKRLECFPDILKAKMVIFQEPAGLEQVRSLKKKIRDLNGIGFSSVHITDTKEEVKNLASYLLNENSFHFLNNTSDTELSSIQHISELKNNMRSDGVSPRDLIVDGSFVFEAYGLRTAEDIDVLIDDSVGEFALLDWEKHDAELNFHGIEKKELIYNPSYYFLLDHVKVVSLRQMIRFKKRRRENKDLLDVKIAEALLQNNLWKKRLVQFQQRYLYFRLRLRIRKRLVNGISGALKVFRLYEIVRFVWRRLGNFYIEIRKG